MLHLMLVDICCCREIGTHPRLIGLQGKLICDAGYAVPKLLVNSQLGPQLAKHLRTLSIHRFSEPFTTDMWAQMCGLCHLQELEIDTSDGRQVHLADVPAAISQLQHLVILVLDDNKTEEEAAWFSASAISSLTSLTKLKLAGADGSCLSNASHLSRLQTVSLAYAGAPLFVPRYVSDLASLSKLELSCLEVGGQVTALASLKGLQVLQCQWIRTQSSLVATLNETLGQLTSLTNLSIRHCSDSLGMGGANMEVLQHLQGLSHLRTLSVVGCGLQQLPVSANWTCLTSLSICGNLFDQLPLLPYLPSLLHLDVSLQSPSFQLPQASDRLASLPLLQKLQLSQINNMAHQWSVDSIFAIADIQCKKRAARLQLDI